jgi:hypothetical protein
MSDGSAKNEKKKRTRPWVRVTLWILAVLLMGATVVYQRLTGPTHPLRGQIEVGGVAHSYRLIRSQTTTEAARVRVPDPGTNARAWLHSRRYPTDEPFTKTVMRPVDKALVGELPLQPAAGKVEYYVTLESPEREHRIPESDTVILRYKDPVPAAVLIPHVILMFFAVLFGLRAGLAALLAPGEMRWLAWTTLAGMTLGGMILGPMVQKYAFGAYWTGWPFGGDLTDNKVLIMWIVWIMTCSTIGFRTMRREMVGRLLVILATLVMTGVYLIPHSMRGSELDYEAVDAGVDPAAAIGTSDE